MERRVALKGLLGLWVGKGVAQRSRVMIATLD